MKRMCTLCGEIKDWPLTTARCLECTAATLRCVPRITLRQLNRRGACLAQVNSFRMRFGKEVEITVERCVEFAHEFDFEWATTDLLHDDHSIEVEHAVFERRPSAGWDAKGYELVLAEEFAKKYMEVYPNVP